MAKLLKRSAKAAKKPSQAATKPDTRNAVVSKRPVQRFNAAARIHSDIHAYNAAQAVGDRRICSALAAAIARYLTGPGAAGVENKIWHAHPVWFIAGNPIVGYHKLKGGGGCIRLLFWSGRSFDEPGLAPEGGFQTAGARYTAADQISAADLKRWLAKSIAIQWDYKNIVKRRGRLERLK